MKYKIFEIREVEVCIPSRDYYSRHNDWYSEDCNIFRFLGEFDREEECMSFLKEKEYCGEFTILPTFKL